MKKINVAINGFGRIGRAFFKNAFNNNEINIVAVNDLTSVENLAYLLKYDSVYGVYNKEVSFDGENGGGNLIVDGKKIKVLAEKEPSLLPWKDMDIDVVIESTGFFTSFEKARSHINAGAKKVIISAPAKDNPTNENEGTVLVGINDEKSKNCSVMSNASCTTNASSPILAILDESIGIEKAILNTVHAYTASQALVDGPSKKDMREGRAAAQNIVPSSTGAAIAVTKALTNLSGKFDGVSTRVPVVCGSIVDITFVSKKNTTVEEVNNIMEEASKSKRWAGIFAVTNEELVSSDIVGRPEASIVDLKFTRVVDGNLVKVLAWYDNETGYVNTLLRQILNS